MTQISPRIASDLALASYRIKNQIRRKSNVGLSKETRNHFDFKMDHIYQGSSGGFFVRQETGFAFILKGHSQQHKNDHVIVFRGTDGLADVLTDVTCHSTTSDTGSSVHTGFQSSFASIRSSLAAYIRQPSVLNGDGIIHCVGHSLGGALATLAADWIKAEFGKKVYLYTFGSPRVGKKDFAIGSSSRIDKVYRAVHGADPVPKIPVWPFYHTHINGHEYLLSKAQGISKAAHSMLNSPGYINTANSNDWNHLYSQSSNSLSQRVVLNYEHRKQTTFSALWADKIAAALLTLLVDGGFAGTVATLQSIGSSVGTIYDIMASSIVKIASIVGMEERVRGVLGCLIAFAGKSIHTPIKFTLEFIKWVFRISIGRINKAARLAIKQS